MKILFWIVALFALAVGLVSVAHYNEGYVLVVLPPYRVEVAFNLFVLAVIAAFFLLYSLVRLVGGAVQMPARVRQYRLARRRAQGQQALLSALEAFFEGSHAQAEQAAARSIGLGEHTRLATVIAARAAHELRAFDRRDRYLRELAQMTSEDDALRGATETELLQNERRDQHARVPQLGNATLPAHINRS